MPRINLRDGISVETIAEITKGTVLGSSSAKLFILSAIEDCREGALCFYHGVSKNAFLKQLEKNKPTAVFVPESFSDIELPEGVSLILHKEPYKAFLSVLPKFFERDSVKGNISPQAFVDPSAEIHPEASIGAFSVIQKGVKIGKGSIIHPHVTIYPRVQIGENTEIHSGVTIREDVKVGSNCIIQNGAIIGADGFGYVPDPARGLVAVPQIGIVELADWTEVGANSCIDRATLGSTSIGLGTKIDNLVQIGHNCQVGSHSIICGQSAIAGSVKIGNQVVIGGSVGIADHTEIADGCRFGGLSGLAGKYTEKADYWGNPAVKAGEHKRIMASLKKLPELMKSLRKGE